MLKSTSAFQGRALALAATILLLAPVAASAAPNELKANDRALAAQARKVAKGEKLVIKGLGLQGQAATSTLELERYDVWRPDAVIEIDGQRVSRPNTAYFRGHADGDDGSDVMISVRESGEVQGLVRKNGKTWLVGKGRNQRGLKSRSTDDAELPPFECGNDTLEATPTGFAHPGEPASGGSAAGTVLDQPYVANIAIETDAEYYNKFGNTSDALDYMADIIGYSDLTYSREVDTDMQIGFARLWTTGTSNDPWTTTSGTSNLLNELRSYWNANMTGTERTVVQMLSGKGLGGGVAWLGQLCDNYRRSGSSYDYGLSASLGTHFNWDGNQNNDPSSVVWDIYVVQHEIGHNFNSPHTHDYCNIGGSSLPIDNCSSGCQSGASLGLPSCSSPTPHFTSGGGAGTIMSYCHQRSGSYGNIAMTFGEGHTCGTLPGRQAARMTSHVVSRAGSHPTCFASSDCGNGTIDAGEDCDGGNLGGATCSSEGFAGGSLSCSASCTFNTSQCTNCGNNVINSGEVCDGSALGGGSCTQEGCTGGGTLACNNTCSGYDTSGCIDCPICDGNGTCDAGEDCNGCPSDCVGGTTNGAVCGNGICEAGNGEDCVSCATDCNGRQNGKPSNRYCCGDGGGQGAVSCSDNRCSASGRTCTNVPSNPESYCCGDATCDAAENCSNCGIDCGGGSEICGNGIDDNCNGQVDCADSACGGGSEICNNGVDDNCNGQTDCNDSACSSAPNCQCGGSGSSCSSNSQCCSGKCHTKGRKANTCS